MTDISVISDNYSDFNLEVILLATLLNLSLHENATHMHGNKGILNHFKYWV